MACIVVETTYDPPLTDELGEEIHERALPCLSARNVSWICSFMSGDRRRSVCRFEGADAETVRQAYRYADVPFDRIWTAQIRQAEDADILTENDASVSIIEGSYDEPFTEEEWDKSNRLLFPCYEEQGVRWIRAFVSLDRRRTICQLRSPDAESICELYHRLGLPFERVWCAQILKPE